MSEFYSEYDVLAEEFYQLPKALILNPLYDDLSASAKIAYTLLKDRHSVSLKNGWIDEIGVFFFMQDKELGELLKCSLKQANRIKNELQAFGLIHMERRGLKKANLLRLKKPKIQKAEKKPVEPYSGNDWTKMSNQDWTKMSNQEWTKMSNNSNKNLSNNNLNKLEEEEESQALQELTSFFKNNITTAGINTVKQKFAKWLELLPFEVIKEELENCALHGAKSWKYVEKALLENRDLKITTIEDLRSKYDRHQEKSKGNKNNKGKVKTARKENSPEWFEKHKEESAARAAAAAEEQKKEYTKEEIEELRKRIQGK